MSLEHVLACIKDRNISLKAEGGELVVQAPKGVMDSSMVALLKSHKHELISALQTRDDAPLRITPDKLTLVKLTQDEIDRIVESLPQGAAQIQDIYPLSPLQEGILFHHFLNTQGDTYLLRSVVAFEHQDDLNRFIDALQTVIDRHDIFRSAMFWQDLSQPVQVVFRHAPMPVEKLSLKPGEDALASILAATDPYHVRLNLQRAPLLAAYTLLDPCSGETLLALLSHHIVCDHISLECIIAEIHLLLQGRGSELPPSLPYRNFIAQLNSISSEQHQAYFKSQLADVKEPTAPFGLIDLQSNDAVFEAKSNLPKQWVDPIKEVARLHGVSAAVLFHLAWAIVLGRCCGSEDVVFGTVLSGRLQGPVGADRTMGLFINTLPIRVRLAETSVLEALNETYMNLSELLVHEQASLAQAQRCSGVQGGLFTTLLNYRHSHPAESSSWHGMRTLLGGQERTHYPITLSVDDFGNGFGLTMQCMQGVDPERMNAYVATAIEGLIGALIQDPKMPIRSLDIMPGAELDRILYDWNAKALDYPKHRFVHHLFEAQVEQTPDAIALRFEHECLSYARLNEKANRLAHKLMTGLDTDNRRVGICTERSLEMVIALLAVLKAGAAYVPLDPHYPKERIDDMLNDSGISLLLTRHGLELSNYLGQTIYPDDPSIDSCASHNPDVFIHPKDTAYIIYTSGSTGKPKGVAVSHGNLLHSTQARLACYSAPVKAYLLLSSFAFDSSVAGIFWTLAQGGSLCLPNDEACKNPVELGALIQRYRISHCLALPSMHALLLTQPMERFESLEVAIVAGEACSSEIVKQHHATLPGVMLYNEYGPTECTVWSSVYPTGVDDFERPVSIGRPIANVRLYILDQKGDPLPIGAVGEIYIGGAGVANGYLNRPELTAEKFVPDAFQKEGGRLYKTGDLARFRDDGCIEFLGRCDHQVKIRGFRIELGEIEARLLAHPDIQEAVVVAREDRPHDKRLAAYWVSESLSVDGEALKRYLQEKLPDYMVPGFFVRLDKMPLGVNAKLDRKSLPSPDLSGQSGKPSIAASSTLEKALVEIWKDLLGLESLGVEDDFFELGGHSLLAVQLTFAVEKRLDVKFPLKTVFEKPTIASQARFLNDGLGDQVFIDLEAEAQLGRDIMPLPSQIIDPANAKALFLTGATGFLGAFLLADLLKQTGACVYCLIRAKDEPEALERLQKQLQRFELLDKVDLKRVMPVCGDLAAERLGLSDKRYLEIAGCVDAIYHNGALVNFVQPYGFLKPANVLSSLEVLRLAATDRPKAIHYVSTLSVFTGVSSSKKGFAETDEPQLPADSSGGYAQSKWVAEKILRSAGERGFQVSFYRPATVAGDSLTGAWNVDDFICRMLKGCIQMGFVPEEDDRLDMAPVDHMSRAIVALSLLPASIGASFHLNHAHPPHASELFDWFRLQGYRLEAVPRNRWVEKLFEANSPDFALKPLLPLFSLQKSQPEHLEDQAIRFDCSQTQSQLAAMGIDCPSIDEALLKRYHDYFVRSGFFECLRTPSPFGTLSQRA